jgi:hypothetical protein
MLHSLGSEKWKYIGNSETNVRTPPDKLTSLGYPMLGLSNHFPHLFKAIERSPDMTKGMAIRPLVTEIFSDCGR